MGRFLLSTVCLLALNVLAKNHGNSGNGNSNGNGGSNDDSSQTQGHGNGNAPFFPPGAPWFDVPASFRRDYIVPDVVPYTPFEPVFVKYNSSVEARLGNRLYTPDIATAPSVFWQADPHAYYTLVMTDPDALSRDNPAYGQFRHWVVSNIPGTNVTQGNTLSSYYNPTPEQGTGLHRYIFLVYGQFNKIDASFSNNTLYGRAWWDVTSWSNQYNLFGPVYGNYFQCGWSNTTASK